MQMQLLRRVARMAALMAACSSVGAAQELVAPRATIVATQEASNAAAPVVLTLKRTIELALQNSKEIQVAKIQASVPDPPPTITRPHSHPTLIPASAPRLTYGIP